MNSSSMNGGSQVPGKGLELPVLLRTGEVVTATRVRVRNTRRLIAQSRELLQRARQALESSKLLRAALERKSERES